MSDYSLYILRCADGSLYTGIAVDVHKRIREHENGVRGAKYLRGKAPLCLEFEQKVGDRGTAQKAEHCVKRLDRPGKEELLAGKRSLDDLLERV